MSTQSTLPFASLGTPLKSLPTNANKKRSRTSENIEPKLLTRSKKAKSNLSSSKTEKNDSHQKSEVFEIDETSNDVQDSMVTDIPTELISSSERPRRTKALKSNIPDETTNHKQQQIIKEQQLRLSKEKEKEEKRKKKEDEKQRRELKKKEIEMEKLQKRLKIELERKQRKEEQDRQKEEKRMKLELEREAKKATLLLEKEEKRLKLEQERLDKFKEKELAEKKRIEEERKKRGAQMGIGSFFKLKNDVVLSPNFKPVTNDPCSYSNSFLKFYVKENAEVFHGTSYSSDEISLNNAKFESSLKGVKPDTLEFFQTSRNVFNKVHKKSTAFEVVQALNNNHSEAEVLELVQCIPKKYLSFYENLKPSYSGTISKTIESVKKVYDIEINKNPFLKLNDATIDYSYDSDLEWNPEEDDEGEGEELDDEEMSAQEGSDDDEDDDDDFLEKDMQLKKRALIGPLIPVIKVYSDLPAETEEDRYFNSLRLESLKFEGPINPFYDYWSTKQETLERKDSEIITISTLNSSVQSKNSASSPLKVNTNTVNVLTGHKKPKQVITNDIELLKVLQYVASNKDLSISTLVELTRKTLDNKYPNLVVRATIDKYFNKKNKKTYELNEEHTISNLKAVVQGIESQST